MLRVKISVATRVFALEIRRALQAAWQLGVHGVQFDLRHELVPAAYGDTARRQLLHFLNERGLQISSGYFPLRSPLAAPERLEERVAALQNAIEFAAQLKIRTLTLRAGRIPAADNAEQRETLQSILGELAHLGNQQGITLCLIPCGDSPEEMRQLIDSVKTGPVTVDADLGGWVMHHQSIPRNLREMHDLIGHFEIRDAIRDVDGHGQEVCFGQGEVDWDEVAGLIEEIGYAGWLNVDRQAGVHRTGDAAVAVEELKSRGLGITDR